MLRILVMVALLAGPAFAGESLLTWSDCTAPESTGSLKNVTIYPNPIAKGYNTTIVGYAQVETQTLEGASYDLKVSYNGGDPFVDQKVDLCGSNEKIVLPFDVLTLFPVGLECPTAPGMVKFVQNVLMNSYPPPGHYDFKALFTNGDGEQIICLALACDM